MGTLDVTLIVVLVLFVLAQGGFVYEINSVNEAVSFSPSAILAGNYALVYLIATVIFAGLIALLFIVKMVRGDEKKMLPQIA